MNQPIRVAQVLGKMNSGGVEAVVMNYYRHIDKSKVQFDIFYDETSECPQKEELLSLGAKVYPIPPYTSVFKYQKELKRILIENNYKIVHSHLSTMSIFPLFAAWRAKVPVRICHNHSTAHFGEGKKTILKYLLRPFNKIFATDYFACGEKAGRWMYGDKAFDNGKVYVMSNAIDTDKFKFSNNYRQEIRKEFNIDENTFVIGHIGRFTFAKNHEFLIDLFAQVAKEKPNSVLILVGEGELEEHIKEKVQNMNLSQKVIFAGVRQDVYKFYSAFDVFCLPSLYEGLPVVSYEAQANGVPCVLSADITKESVINSNVTIVSINGQQAVERWVMELIDNKKHISSQVPDVKDCAKKLLESYDTRNKYLKL